MICTIILLAALQAATPKSTPPTPHPDPKPPQVPTAQSHQALSPIQQALEDSKIEIAIKDFEIDELSLKSLQQKIPMEHQQIQGMIDEVKKQRGLDETWDFDGNSGKFYKLPPKEKK